MSFSPGYEADEAVGDGRLVEEYLNDLAFRKRSSKNTVESYRSDLSRFRNFLAEERKIGLTRVERVDLLAFMVFCENSGDSARTRSRRLSALRGFYSFLKQRGRIQESPVTGLRSVKIPDTLPDVLSRDDIKKLLDAGRKGDKIQRRTGMLLELMYASGVRISEAVNLKLEHVLMDDGALIIESGKGAKGRIVLIPPQTVKNLDEYIRGARELILDGAYSRYVFPTSSGRPIDRQSAWRCMKKLGIDAGISIELHPHLLRHTCATHLLENGCDLMTVQILLGHADIGTTEIYTHILEERKRNVFHRAHPRARS